MKRTFIHVQTSLDEKAAAACGYVRDADPIPTPLQQVDAITFFEANLDPMLEGNPPTFKLRRQVVDDVCTEDDLIIFADALCFLSHQSKGSSIASLDQTCEVLFYRGLATGVELVGLCGVKTPDGRKLAVRVEPCDAGSKPPTLWQQLAAFGIPNDGQFGAASFGEGEDGAKRHAEFTAVTAWLVLTMLESPDDQDHISKCWNSLAEWIRAASTREHLLPIADALPQRFLAMPQSGDRFEGE